jgi:hypothetical protein
MDAKEGKGMNHVHEPIYYQHEMIAYLMLFVMVWARERLTTNDGKPR